MNSLFCFSIEPHLSLMREYRNYENDKKQLLKTNKQNVTKKRREHKKYMQNNTDKIKFKNKFYALYLTKTDYKMQFHFSSNV